MSTVNAKLRRIRREHRSTRSTERFPTVPVETQVGLSLLRPVI